MSVARVGSDALVCPRCATSQPPEVRFCPDCGMPLVLSSAAYAEQPATERQRHARKIKPQLAEGELVRVLGANNQAEAEFIQGMLLEEGVPSMLRRSAGFDVPDFLAAGPRDILVPASGLATAREVLLQAELIDPTQLRAAAGARPAPGRLLAGLLLALAVGGLLIWLTSVLGH